MKKVSKKQSKRKPWITRGILKSISQRDKIFKRFVKERDVSEKANIFRNFKTLRNRIVNLIRESKRLHYRHSFKKTSQNQKICGKVSTS